MSFQQISLPMRSLLSGHYNLARSFLHTPAPFYLTEMTELYYTPIELYVSQTTAFDNTYGWSCYINYASASDPYPSEINIVINKGGVAIPVTLTYQGVEGLSRRWYRSGATGSYTFTVADLIWINGIEYDDEVPPDEITGIASHFAIRANTIQGDIQPLKAGLYSRVNVGTPSVTACFVDYFEYDTVYMEYVSSGLGQQIVLDNLYQFDSEFRRNYFGEINDTETNLINSPDTLYASPDKVLQDTVSIRITSKEPVPIEPVITPEEKMAIETQLSLIYSALLTLAKDETLQEIASSAEILSTDPVTCEQLSGYTDKIASAVVSLSLQTEVNALKESLDVIGEQVEFHTEQLIGIHSASDSLIVKMTDQITEFEHLNTAVKSASGTLKIIDDTIRSAGHTIEDQIYSGQEKIAYETGLGLYNLYRQMEDTTAPKIERIATMLEQPISLGIVSGKDTLIRMDEKLERLTTKVESLDFDKIISSLATIGFDIEMIDESIEAGELSPTIFIDNIGDEQLEIRSDDLDI